MSGGEGVCYAAALCSECSHLIRSDARQALLRQLPLKHLLLDRARQLDVLPLQRQLLRGLQLPVSGRKEILLQRLGDKRQELAKGAAPAGGNEGDQSSDEDGVPF